MRIPEPPHLRAAVVGADPLARWGLSAALDDIDDILITLQLHPDALSADSDDNLREIDALLWDLGLKTDDPTLALARPTVALVETLEDARAALGSGAHGVLHRHSPAARIGAGLRAVVEGAWVLDDAFAQQLLGDAGRGAPPDLVEPLSPREMDVLELLAEGLSNRRIAGRLGISSHTVKFHVDAILGKLDASTRTEAVVTAARLNLIRL
ncbi:MAG: response regulator transcription factor [Myxococcota bacterium]